MTTATLQPPAAPVVIYSAAGASAGTMTSTRSSGGTALCTNSATPIAACAAALNTAGVNASALVNLLAPSGNPLWQGQLGDMLLVTGR
jgi:hypothetical protein